MSISKNSFQPNSCWFLLDFLKLNLEIHVALFFLLFREKAVRLLLSHECCLSSTEQSYDELLPLRSNLVDILFPFCLSKLVTDWLKMGIG